MKRILVFGVTLSLVSIGIIIFLSKNEFQSISSFFNSKEKILLGKWELVSMINYSNGKEHQKVERTHEMNYLLGSNSAPKYYIFSKYNEMLWDTYPVGNTYNRNADNYKIIDNKIVLDGGKSFFIEKMSNEELVLREELILSYPDENTYNPKIYYVWQLKKCSNNE